MTEICSGDGPLTGAGGDGKPTVNGNPGVSETDCGGPPYDPDDSSGAPTGYGGAGESVIWSGDGPYGGPKNSVWNGLCRGHPCSGLPGVAVIPYVRVVP